MDRQTYIILAITIVAAAALIWWQNSIRNGTKMVDVSLPQLSSSVQEGAEFFMANCSSCHGARAQGSETGPPLIHIIYEPNHHADQSFFNAVTRVVRAHHWKFGDMPPVDGLMAPEIGQMIAFVREVQRHNGIN